MVYASPAQFSIFGAIIIAIFVWNQQNQEAFSKTSAGGTPPKHIAVINCDTAASA